MMIPALFLTIYSAIALLFLPFIPKKVAGFNEGNANNNIEPDTLSKTGTMDD